MKNIITLALVICAVSTTAQAQSFSKLSGNTLNERCPDGTNSNAWQQEAWCLGYMEGYRDGIWLGHSSDAKAICIPPEVSNTQMRDVALRALSETPETRHKRAYGLVGNALAKAWPCP